MRALIQRLVIPVLIVAALAAIGVAASRYTSLDWFVHNDRWLRELIRQRPIVSCLIGFTSYLALSLIPGTSGKSIILGWLFGLVVGVIIVNCALVVAALVVFSLSRHYLRAAVQSRFGFYLKPLQQRMEQDGAVYLLTLRLAHAPFSLMNYAAGAGTQIPFRTFWWTTQVGLLPGNIVFVFAGTRLPTLEELARQGPLGLLDAPMIAALVGTVVLPWMARRIIRLFPSHKTAPSDNAAVRERTSEPQS